MGAVKKIILTVVFTSGQTGSRTFSLKEGQGIIIGRLTNATELVPPNALKFASKVISRKHAQIFVIEDKICIRDTKSSSGTFVNGQRLSAQGEESDFIELCTQDQITIGEDCYVDGVEYKAVAMDITIDRELVNQAGSNLIQSPISASVSDAIPPPVNQSNAALKSNQENFGTPKPTSLATDLGEDEELTTFSSTRDPLDKATRILGKNLKPELEKPLVKAGSIHSLKQTFENLGEAKSKGSLTNLDFAGKRAKDGKPTIRINSKEDLGKSRSKEDLVKMESEKSAQGSIEIKNQQDMLKKLDEKVIIPLVRELTAIDEGSIAPLKTVYAKESVLTEIRNSRMHDTIKSSTAGSQFSFSEIPETLPGEFQSDLQIETDLVWSGILDGLDGSFMRYLFLTLPTSKSAKDKGLLGDAEKQDLMRKSYSFVKSFSKNNMTSVKKDASLGSSASMKVSTLPTIQSES